MRRSASSEPAAGSATPGRSRSPVRTAEHHPRRARRPATRAPPARTARTRSTLQPGPRADGSAAVSQRTASSRTPRRIRSVRSCSLPHADPAESRRPDRAPRRETCGGGGWRPYGSSGCSCRCGAASPPRPAMGAAPRHPSAFVRYRRTGAGAAVPLGYLGSRVLLRGTVLICGDRREQSVRHAGAPARDDSTPAAGGLGRPAARHLRSRAHDPAWTAGVGHRGAPRVHPRRESRGDGRHHQDLGGQWQLRRPRASPLQGPRP